MESKLFELQIFYFTPIDTILILRHNGSNPNLRDYFNDKDLWLHENP